MATFYNINDNTHGVNGFGSPFCDTIYSATLLATTDTTLTVPGKAALGMASQSGTNTYLAVFSYTTNTFVALNATAAVPAGNTFAATTSELNPTCKKVKAGDVIHFYSSGTPSITVALYSVQEG